MEIKTLEELFLKQYTDLEEEVAELKEKLKRAECMLERFVDKDILKECYYNHD